MPNRLTTAYAGSGNITADNAKLHLDQFLPDALGLVFIPDHVARKQSGLKHVIAWLEGELGSDATIPSDDLVQALLDRAEYDEDGETFHDDLALVMLFDRNNEDDVELAQRAHEAGIRVVDLCAAHDDLLPDLFAEEPEETAPTEAVAKPVEEETPPWDENPAARAIRKATEAGVAAAELAQEAPAAPVLTTKAAGVSVKLTLSLEDVRVLARALLDEMNVLSAAEAVSVAPEPVLENGSAVGQPEQPDPGPGPDRKHFYYSTVTDKYRPARGRKRPDEQDAYLTAIKIREVTAIGMMA